MGLVCDDTESGVHTLSPPLATTSALGSAHFRAPLRVGSAGMSSSQILLESHRFSLVILDTHTHIHTEVSLSKQ